MAEKVARHLVAAGRLVDEDPGAALDHAVAARRLAARIAVVREAVGIAAYHAGEWQTAAAELRTYHRMTGRQTHLAVLADCERALGRPEKAIDIYRSADGAQMDRAEAVELLIVAAGARRDLGQHEAALAMLQVRELTADGPWAARLRYAYADALLAMDRPEEAREWFSRAVEADSEGQTDAPERLLELDGVALDDEDDEDDEPGDGTGEDDDADEGDDDDPDDDDDDADDDDGGDADLDEGDAFDDEDDEDDEYDGEAYEFDCVEPGGESDGELDEEDFGDLDEDDLGGEDDGELDEAEDDDLEGDEFDEDEGGPRNEAPADETIDEFADAAVDEPARAPLREPEPEPGGGQLRAAGEPGREEPR